MQCFIARPFCHTHCTFQWIKHAKPCAVAEDTKFVGFNMKRRNKGKNEERISNIGSGPGVTCQRQWRSDISACSYLCEYLDSIVDKLSFGWPWSEDPVVGSEKSRM